MCVLIIFEAGKLLFVRCILCLQWIIVDWEASCTQYCASCNVFGFKILGTFPLKLAVLVYGMMIHGWNLDPWLVIQITLMTSQAGSVPLHCHTLLKIATQALGAIAVSQFVWMCESRGSMPLYSTTFLQQRSWTSSMCEDGCWQWDTSQLYVNVSYICLKECTGLKEFNSLQVILSGMSKGIFEWFLLIWVFLLASIKSSFVTMLL